ncbi:hypothetical protein ACS0TY_001790 [Phlomoides rotata]
MQESLDKCKEEERNQRDEEERLKKDEEEWRRQVERERLAAEDKKRLNNEREKDKKQEGKLLTGKQTEEACCLDAWRKQILASASFPLTPGESSGAPAKRPLYQKKKSKPQTQSNGAAILDSVNSTDTKEIPQEIVVELDSGEPETVEKVEFGTRKDKTEIADIVEENGLNDDDEEWDAKNWDKADLKLQGKSAFSDVEVDSEPEPLLKKEAKNARPALQIVELPSAKPASQNAVVRKRDSAAEGDDQKINKRKQKS